MADKDRRKLGIGEIAGRKGSARLAMVTAYDVLTARLVEAAGIDLILVGDSMGMVLLGHESTVPVTVEDIIRHTQAVRRGAPKTHIVADLPFMAARSFARAWRATGNIPISGTWSARSKG